MGNRKKKFINVTLSIFMLFTCIHFTGIKATEDELNVDEPTVVESNVNEETLTEDDGEEQSESNDEIQNDSDSNDKELNVEESNEDDSKDVSNEENSYDEEINLLSLEGQDDNGNNDQNDGQTETVTVRYVSAGDVDGGYAVKTDETFSTSGEPTGTTVKVMSYYEFVGWYDNADCTGTPLSTDASATFIPTTPTGGWVSGQTYTYYAKFHYQDKYLKTVYANYYWIGDKDNPDKSPISASTVVAQNVKIGENVTGVTQSDKLLHYKATDTSAKGITVWEDDSKNVFNFYYYKKVKLIANSAEYEYDFSAHTVSGFESFLTSDTYKKNKLDITFANLSASATGTDVGTYTSTITNSVGDVAGTVDDSGCYYVESATNGSLTITDALVIRTYNFEATFNRKNIGGTTPDINPEGGTVVLYSTDSKDVTDTTKEWTTTKPTFVNVGKYKVDVKATNENYDPSVVYGSYTVTITPQDISDPASFVNVGKLDDVDYYDGQEHKLEPTVSDKRYGPSGQAIDIVKGRDYTISYSDDVTNAGEVTVTVKGIGNYTGEVTRTYTINPRPVTLVSGSSEKEYDGTALTNSTVNYALDSLQFLEGEEPEITTTGTITDVKVDENNRVIGVPNTFEVKESKDSKYKASNYTIAKQEGTLKVTPITTDVTVTITAINSEIVYDGQYHAVNDSYTAVASNPLYKVDGDDRFYGKNDRAGAKYKDVTPEGEEWETGIKASDFYNNTNNFTGNITFVVENGTSGTLKIIPRTYSITTYSASKEYDGTALTASGKIVGLVEGETATFTITGSQTSVGSSKNTYKDFEFTGDTKASNYVHGEDTIGTLTVTEKSSKKSSGGWDDGGPFTTDTCGNVFDRWGNKIYEAKGCNVDGYNLVSTSVED